MLGNTAQITCMIWLARRRMPARNRERLLDAAVISSGFALVVAIFLILHLLQNPLLFNLTTAISLAVYGLLGAAALHPGFADLTMASSDDRPEMPAAAEIVESLRRATPDRQTFSAGIATWDTAEPADELVARADAALYAAKNAGRDRSVLAGAVLV